MFRIYLKNTWRNLRKQRTTSVINIAGLAIGMACAGLIFLWVQNEMTFDSYHKNAELIYRTKGWLAVDKNTTWVLENSPYLLKTNAEKQIPEIEKVSRVQTAYSTVYFNFNNEFFPEKKVAYVDDNWFDIFHYDFLEGTSADFNSNRYSLALTAATAKKYFGNKDAIGKIIRIDTIDYQVEAVIKNNPTNSSFQFDALIPLAGTLASKSGMNNAMSWGNFNYQTFVQLEPGASTTGVSQKLRNILKANRDKDNTAMSLIGLKDLHFENDIEHSALDHGDKRTVYIFASLGILILLIACINYVNLTTARSTLRVKEVSIKKIVGAERSQLLFQFILESVVISCIALVLSVVIIGAALPFFNQLAEKKFEILTILPLLGIILFATLILVIILTSIYPAILLSSFKPIQIFRGINFLNIRDSSLRKILVVSQFTISILLIIAVIIANSQMRFIRNQNYGYDRSQILSISFPSKIFYKLDADRRSSMVNAFKQKLSSYSTIEDISSINQNSIINMKGWSSGSADWKGRDPDFQPEIAYFDVDYDFKKMINLQMAEGNWFTENAQPDGRNMILNETAVHEFNLPQPVVGMPFITQGDTGQIVGVVKDFYYKNLHEKIGPVVIKNVNDYNSTFLLKLRGGMLQSAIGSLQNVWKEFFPGQPFQYYFLDDEFNLLYQKDQRTSTLIWIFAVIAVIVSCMGLFGLSAFSAERRVKEIGIRKVLGASVITILKLLSKDFVLLVLIAFAIAAPLAGWIMSKWLQEFAYHISLGWWIFLLSGTMAFAIAIFTVSFQALKAAVTNPINSLRTE